jgi:ATP-dependent helicase/nuclease subunit A
MRPTENIKKFNDSQRHALDTRRNLAVRANAGSGKTSVLVERIAQLLAQSWDDKKPLDLTQIVAITFTRKAAAELEDRLRSSFREIASLTADPDERAFWAARTEELPRAMIGTIDSFCARILRDFGLLDSSPDRFEPDFAPLEGYEASTLKREAVDRLIDELTSAAGHGSDSPATGEQTEACRWWAENEGYYALTTYLMQLLDHAVEPHKIIGTHRGLSSPGERVRAVWEKMPAVQAMKKNRAALIDQLQTIISETEGTDKAALQDLQERLRQALTAFRRSDPSSIAAGLESLHAALFNKNQEPRSTRTMKEVEDELLALQDQWCPLLKAFQFDFDAEARALEAADKLAILLAPAYENYLALCREANQYDFWTIARRTRDLLAGNSEIRAGLKNRYRYVMVDEFQDTNQLQWEIISWVVGNGPDGPLDRDRLFIVGDPQQSIYRFRKADVGVFSRVQDKIQEANRSYGADRVLTLFDGQRPSPSSSLEQRLGVVPLQENYRSLKPVPLEVMDRVFRYTFDPTIHQLDLERNRFEIEYQKLIPGVTCNATGEIRYVVVGESEADSATEEEGDQEGAPVVQDLPGKQVQAAIDQLASLRGQPKHIVKHDEDSTLKWRDMAILLPSRDVVLGKLEKELTRRGIPYVVTSGIGFWQRQEVRDIVSLACFLANAGDELALFAVLRGPLGQLVDSEVLFLSQLGRGRIAKGLRILASGVSYDPGHRGVNTPRSPDSLEQMRRSAAEDLESDGDSWNQLSEAMQTALARFWGETSAADRQRLRDVAGQLDTWRKRVDRMAHSDLLQRCLEESGAYAIYAAGPEGELILANLRRLFERIRVEEARFALGMARLARWMRDQVDDALRDEQAILAAGQDAVQIMTVHAAKGLEFPVVAVLKMERRADQSRPSRLLVKSEWDRLLTKDESENPEVRAGTLAVATRHPHRPREIYTPRLLTALRDLERAQELAESRRLFYVAATRARERLILAGRQPRQKKDGGAYKLPESWQKWFEEALVITDEDKKNNIWEDSSKNWKLHIITEISSQDEKFEPTLQTIPNRICLDYLHERPRSPTIAATGLETMRATWAKPEEWWLKYRVKVRPHMPKISSKSETRNPETAIPDEARENGGPEENLGTVLGTLVHRLFELGPEPLQASKENRQALLGSMASNLLAVSQSPDDPEGERESAVVQSPLVDRVVAGVERILERLKGGKAIAVRRLLEAEGESEVEFLLTIGRWHITGRFDKLMRQSNGSFEIIDWKTDSDADWQQVVKRYRDKQMKLYALALYRSARPALIDGAIHVHLALLHHSRVEVLCFLVDELEAFSSELEKELEAMDRFGQ